jgi:hypothetical protein
MDRIQEQHIATLERENQRLRDLMTARDHEEAQKLAAIQEAVLKQQDDDNALQRERMRKDAAERFRKSDWQAWFVVNSKEDTESTIYNLDRKVSEKMATPDLWAPGHSIADWSATLDGLREIEPAPPIGQGEGYMETYLKTLK